MKSVFSQKPCDTCCVYSQVGNPYNWERECDRCIKLGQWKNEVLIRLSKIEDILGDDYDLDRLKELVEADKEGRCITLPCKVGDPIWEVIDSCNFPGDCCAKQTCKGCEYRDIFKEKLALTLYMLSESGKLEPPYYASEKEAEAALEKMKGGNE